MASTFTPELVPSQPITTDDLERDRVFSQRVRLFGWIREKHLDVPEGEAAQGFLGFAEQGVCVCFRFNNAREVFTDTRGAKSY